MPRSVLIVIDVQHEYVDGALPVAHPAPAAALERVGAALDVAARHRIPVVVVRHDDGADAPVFASGSAGAALAGPVADLEPAAIVVKRGYSAFAGTDLADVLERLGADVLVLAGFLTHVCVDSTARDAADRGFAVEVLRDATGTFDLRDIGAAALHEATLAALASAFAAVRTTEQWAAEAAADQAPAAPDLLTSAREGRRP